MARPVKQFRMGNVSVSIFDNGGFYNACPQRGYKKDEEWQYTSQFRPADMAVLLFLMPKAMDWINEREAQDNNTRAAASFNKPPTETSVSDDDIPF